MPTMLSSSHTALVQSSFRALLPISDTVARLFYDRLFELAPEVRPLFKGNIDQQGPKLIGMLAIAVKQLERPEDLIPALRELGKRHVDYGVKREHYALVGAAFLWTLRESLGASFTEDVRTAWATTFGFLAGVCIDAAYPAEIAA
jgi:hemoglobin-like flavoprotein